MTTANLTVSILQAKVNGQPLPGPLDNALQDVEVHNDIYLPDTAQLRFHMYSFSGDYTSIPDTEVVDYLPRGAEIEIVQKGSSSGDLTIFKGEVTAVEVGFGTLNASDPAVAIVRAMDKSHRLHRSRATKTYLNQKYSDIATAIAQGAGLSAQVNATSQVFEHVLQMGQSNWDFLWQMAARIGYEVFFHDGKLHFIEPQTSPGDTISLQWGKELLSFHARMTASHQVSSVKVRGWDSKQQKEIIGQAATSSLYPSVGESRNGKAIADAAFSATDLEVVDLPVVDQSEANALAQAVFDGTAGEFLQAEGTTTFGIASLLPRCLVDIGSVGTKFGGTYFVTSTVHRFNGIDGYTTSFSVSGTRPGSLYGMIAGDSPVPPVRRIEGVVPAKVTNNNDPDGIGRVKVSFPWMGESIESNWVRIASPDAGNERGFHFTPEIDDEVLISFEFGDVQRPYVIGSLWSAKQKPPQPTSDAVANGKVNVRMIKTRAGHIIKLDDTSGSEKIEIIDRTGKNTIVIDSSANTLDINVDADITITPGGKCTIKATGDISIESSGNIAMKAGGNFDLEATGNMTIKGMQLSAEGQTKAELKGAMVGVTGSAMAEIKAGLVKIN